MKLITKRITITCPVQNVRRLYETMPPKKKGKKDFVWTDDEAELLLNVNHHYKVQQLAEGSKQIT